MRNEKVLKNLLILLESAAAAAAGLMDNCLDDKQAIPPGTASLIRNQLDQIGQHVDNAMAWPVPQRRIAMPTGHRLPTYLDSHQ